jgi:hypothetical protein
MDILHQLREIAFVAEHKRSSLSTCNSKAGRHGRGVPACIIDVSDFPVTSVDDASL